MRKIVILLTVFALIVIFCFAIGCGPDLRPEYSGKMDVYCYRGTDRVGSSNAALVLEDVNAFDHPKGKDWVFESRKYVWTVPETFDIVLRRTR